MRTPRRAFAGSAEEGGGDLRKLQQHVALAAGHGPVAHAWRQDQQLAQENLEAGAPRTPCSPRSDRRVAVLTLSGRTRRARTGGGVVWGVHQRATTQDHGDRYPVMYAFSQTLVRSALASARV